MPTMRDVTNEDHDPWRWWRRGQRLIVTFVTAGGAGDRTWSRISTEQAVEPLGDAALAEIVIAARQCLTKRTG